MAFDSIIHKRSVLIGAAIGLFMTGGLSIAYFYFAPASPAACAPVASAPVASTTTETVPALPLAANNVTLPQQALPEVLQNAVDKSREVARPEQDYNPAEAYPKNPARVGGPADGKARKPNATERQLRAQAAYHVQVLAMNVAPYNMGANSGQMCRVMGPAVRIFRNAVPVMMPTQMIQFDIPCQSGNEAPPVGAPAVNAASLRRTPYIEAYLSQPSGSEYNLYSVTGWQFRILPRFATDSPLLLAQ